MIPTLVEAVIDSIAYEHNPRNLVRMLMQARALSQEKAVPVILERLTSVVDMSCQMSLLGAADAAVHNEGSERHFTLKEFLLALHAATEEDKSDPGPPPREEKEEKREPRRPPVLKKVPDVVKLHELPFDDLLYILGNDSLNVGNEDIVYRYIDKVFFSFTRLSASGLGRVCVF